MERILGAIGDVLYHFAISESSPQNPRRYLSINSIANQDERTKTLLLA